MPARKSRRRLLFLAAGIALIAGTALQVPSLCLKFAERALEGHANDRALGWLDRAAAWGASGQEIAVARATAYRRQGRFAEVREELLRARTLGVPVSRLQREQWLALAQAGQLNEVDHHLGELLRGSVPSPQDVCDAYISGFLLTAQPGRAIELAQVWLADHPDDVQAHYLLGKARMFAREYAAAEPSLTRARQLAPTRPDVALALGDCLLELQHPQEALDCFVVAAESELLREAGLFGESRAARRIGQPQRAKELLQKLVQQNPRMAAAWEELGRIEFDQQKFEAAVQLLQQAVELSPGSLSAREALGRGFIAVGRPEEARPHLKFCQQTADQLQQIRLMEDQSEQEPDNVSVRLKIAHAYSDLGTPELAQVWANAVLVIDPLNAEAHALKATMQPPAPINRAD